MAVQLASRPRHFFCPRVPIEPDITLTEDPLVLSQLTGMSNGGSASSSRPQTPLNGTPMGSPNLSRRGVKAGEGEGGRVSVGGRGGTGTPPTGRAPSPSLNGPSGMSGSSNLGLGGLLFRDSLNNNNHIVQGTSTSNASAQLSSSPSDRPFHHSTNPSASTSPGSTSTPTNDTSIISPQTSRPFFYSLLSSSPFASIFRTTSDTHLENPMVNGIDLARTRSANPFLGGSGGSVDRLEGGAESEVPVVSEPKRSAYEYLGLGVLGRLGSEASARSSHLGHGLDTPERSDSPNFSTTNSEGLGQSYSDDHAFPLHDEPEQQLSLVYLTLPLLEKAIATYRVPLPARSRAATEEPVKSMDDETLPLYVMEETGLEEVDEETIVTEDPTFLLPNVDINSLELGLDIPSIRASYNMILALEPRQLFERTLVNALEILLASLQLNMQRLQTGAPHLLRQFFVVLENPLLRNGHYHETLLKKLCIVLGQLRSKSKQVLVNWFASYDMEGLQSFIDLFQIYITDHFFPNTPKVDEAIIGAIKNLSLLYHANDASAGRIPISSFYNEALNRKVNFKEEYKNWKKTLAAKKIVEFSVFNYPFLFDPVAKTRILHIDAMVQMSMEFEEAVVNQAIVIHAQKFLQDSPSVTNLEQELKGATNPFLVLEVRRQHLVKDVLDQIRRKEKDMKKPLKVKFVGGGEEGMDQGGVQKEFFQVLVNMLLDPAYGMFTYEEETRYVWINGASLEAEKKFELVGTVIGLALYNGVILGINFPRLLYKKLLDEEPTLEDIKQAFPALGKGLQQLLDWTDGDVGDIFLRTFEISYEVYGQVKTFPLVENGDETLVTNENRQEYVHLYINHLVGEFIKRQFNAFRRGFHRVCGGRALKMCRSEELELLICGTAELDFKDLEKGAEYDDGYGPNHQVIMWFWEIVHGMPFEQKKKLLNFVTASDRVPLKGLGNLTFVIQRNGPDTDRLPTALTCFGRLLLPEYSEKDKLSNRLITAIENAKGFGLV
ncbi:hypothetical protein HDU67_005287 [Dinochytrium kinnereticum]|nr:hypothetical protein HDU67_005287 [Dinochytrium kinnereticum]